MLPIRPKQTKMRTDPEAETTQGENAESQSQPKNGVATTKVESYGWYENHPLSDMSDMSDMSEIYNLCKCGNVKPEQMDMMRKQTAMCFTSRASSCCGLNRFDWKTIFSFVCLLSSSMSECFCFWSILFVAILCFTSTKGHRVASRDPMELVCLFLSVLLDFGPMWYCYCYWSKVLLC